MLMCLILLGLVSQASAAPEQYRTNIKISGRVLVTGKCTFDNKGALSKIDFGTVRYNALQTLESSYRQSLASGMSCSGDSAGSTMILSSFDNRGVAYQGHILLPVKDNHAGEQSSDLAIRLWVNGSVQDINKSFAIDMEHQPKLEAELVQIGKGKSFVNGSTFSASATLTMTFI